MSQDEICNAYKRADNAGNEIAFINAVLDFAVAAGERSEGVNKDFLNRMKRDIAKDVRKRGYLGPGADLESRATHIKISEVAGWNVGELSKILMWQVIAGYEETEGAFAYTVKTNDLADKIKSFRNKTKDLTSN